MAPEWMRLWITAVAMTVCEESNVEERECWKMARTLWASMVEDDRQTHWSDRCGFFKREKLVDVLRRYDKFNGVNIYAITRVIRKAMIETTARVWRCRIQMLCERRL